MKEPGLPKTIRLYKRHFDGGVYTSNQFIDAHYCPIALALKEKYPKVYFRVGTGQICINDTTYPTEYIGTDVVKKAINTINSGSKYAVVRFLK